jgi:peptide/nickel transport system ATP-binding protein/oligopeptide transport system ATP-binding protein
MELPLLEVTDLRTYFATDRGLVQAVDGATYTINEGETLAVVGESGSGKTVTALSILGVLDSAPGIIGGSILFKGKELLQGLEKFCYVVRDDGQIQIRKDCNGWRRQHWTNLREIRGKEISMIFQEPVSSLSPLYTIGEQIAESMRARYKDLSKRDALDSAVRWLEKVKIPDPKRAVSSYSFQLSGGMCQRVMLAIALASEPSLLIADEPTTSVDVSLQIEILQLLKALQEEQELSILFITHDMAVAANFADSVAVMYAGRVVEFGRKEDIFSTASPSNHPYTQGLLNSIPRLDAKLDPEKLIKGSVPDSIHLPQGCKFHPRCGVLHTLPDGGGICRESEPAEFELGPNHFVRCWKYEGLPVRKRYSERGRQD